MLAEDSWCLPAAHFSGLGDDFSDFRTERSRLNHALVIGPVMAAPKARPQRAGPGLPARHVAARAAAFVCLFAQRREHCAPVAASEGHC